MLTGGDTTVCVSSTTPTELHTRGSSNMQHRGNAAHSSNIMKLANNAVHSLTPPPLPCVRSPTATAPHLQLHTGWTVIACPFSVPGITVVWGTLDPVSTYSSRRPGSDRRMDSKQWVGVHQKDRGPKQRDYTVCTSKFTLAHPVFGWTPPTDSG